MRISDWSSDVCSSDLGGKAREQRVDRVLAGRDAADDVRDDVHDMAVELDGIAVGDAHAAADRSAADVVAAEVEQHQMLGAFLGRSEEHTSELPSLMRNSYAVFCLKNKHKHSQYKE